MLVAPLFTHGLIINNSIIIIIVVVGLALVDIHIRGIASVRTHLSPWPRSSSVRCDVHVTHGTVALEMHALRATYVRSSDRVLSTHHSFRSRTYVVLYVRGHHTRRRGQKRRRTVGSTDSIGTTPSPGHLKQTGALRPPAIRAPAPRDGRAVARASGRDATTAEPLLARVVVDWWVFNYY